jgi:endogenous inhibitor of DNA gyrase (YacG/DUF329 family)
VSVIWITCPTTGRQVSTGIETDAESFAALPAWTLTLTCPDCGQIHPWADMQGVLVETPAERRLTH